ncbi:MAG TPA: type VI secretion system baseplate subunit TssG, partial [Bryobacteraceae bacterium]|nr:type VI secretion system baseplate subunit TssG [Bryobacteraceae bacterium]
DGAAFPKLQAMCRFYAGQDIDFEIQLVLRREEAPKCQLGAVGATAPRLGWLSWARRKPLAKDPDETLFRLQEET